MTNTIVARPETLSAITHLELRHVIGNRYDVLRDGTQIGYISESAANAPLAYYAHPVGRYFDTAELAVVAVERAFIRRQAEEAA